MQKTKVIAKPPMLPADKAAADSFIGYKWEAKFERIATVESFVYFLLLVGWLLLMATMASAQEMAGNDIVENKLTINQEVTPALDAGKSEAKHGNLESSTVTHNIPEKQDEHTIMALTVTVTIPENNAIIKRADLHHELHRERDITDDRINTLKEQIKEQANTQDWKINMVDQRMNIFIGILALIFSIGLVSAWLAIRRNVIKTAGKITKEIADNFLKDLDRLAKESIKRVAQEAKKSIEDMGARTIDKYIQDDRAKKEK